ncbi:MAG: monomeric [FeFe] hydrogenase [Bacteroidales bacterium]
MSVTNNAMIIRRDLLTRIVKLLENDQLEERIDRIPLEIRPRYNAPVRCCVHKDRAVLKYKLMAILGFNIQDETDELTPLSTYARMAIERKEHSDMFLTVVDEACSSCRQTSYEVSNLCRGCVARPCINNCPKDAMVFIDGKAHINHKLCVNCGKCLKMCPFHAIVYMPVPCEEVCPVNAISKNDRGVEEINPEKCINCGKCIVACPFGAVMEKSNLVDIFKAKKEGRSLIALMAPAIAGQFGAEIGRIINSFRHLGFEHVYEVAQGAEQTILNEAEEWREKMSEGAHVMTSSCCPSYTSWVEKHSPDLKPFVSHTHTPLYYTAQMVRERHPEACLVFISPCTAKRHEVYHNPLVDYTLSFEEYGSWLVARGIDLKSLDDTGTEYVPAALARGFAAAGGVAAAVKTLAPEMKDMVINGLDKSNIRLLKSFAKSSDANFVEVMSCENGCIGGCNVISNPKVAARQLKEAMKNAPSIDKVFEEQH